MTAQKLTQAQLKKKLETYNPKELIAEISELYRRFPDVKIIIKLNFLPNQKARLSMNIKQRSKKSFSPHEASVELGYLLPKSPLVNTKKSALTLLV